jgi:hypothetical protein
MFEITSILNDSVQQNIPNIHSKIRKNYFKYFSKGDQFAHQKINEKTHFSSNLSKNEDFFKIKNTNDYLNY